MYFWKMSGAGNDFIMINNTKESIPKEKFPAIARRLCQRHISIGADGIMVAEKTAEADIKAMIFNADGSEAEMCGNGVRCFARFAWEEKLAGNPMRIETKAGCTEVERITNREYKGKLQSISGIREGGKAVVNGREYSYTYMEVGKPGLPHIVVPVKNLKNADRETLFKDGKSLRYYSDFPNGTNVNFCDVIDDKTVELLTWERGVEDFTFACGTGSVSTVMALRRQKKVGAGTVSLRSPGGVLKVDLVEKAGNDFDVYLAGDTNIVCKGEVTDEDLSI